MYRYIFITIISTLFIFTSDAFAQKLSADKAVMSPYLDLKDMPEQDGSVIIRKYMPFDDVTLFTTVFGGQVYNDKQLRINMFPLALTKGEVHSANPKNTSLGLQFFSYSNSENSEQDSFKPQGITFLIDNERHQLKIYEIPKKLIENQ